MENAYKRIFSRPRAPAPSARPKTRVHAAPCAVRASGDHTAQTHIHSQSLCGCAPSHHTITNENLSSPIKTEDEVQP